MRGVNSLLLGLCVLSLIACGGGKKKHYYVDEGLNDVRPYISGTPYENVLKRCALADEGQSCTLETLPVLGMDTSAPTVDAVMSRVVVSHPWMGARLREVLNGMPDDLLLLFSSITVVVVDDDIRPSFYNPVTAAIYLDPDHLWLEPQEEATISDKEDYRGEYIRQMSYRPVWRYVNGPPGTLDDVRSIEDITVDTAQLLFHELAHASDIFPRSTFLTVNRSQPVEVITNSLKSVFPSTLLLTTYPLESDVMFDLAGILYGGDTATPAYRAMSAAEVGGHFAPDGANDDYNYYSQYEDLAMLFEEAMMKFHFDMDRDVGFTNAAESYYCDDYILGWGQRNRMGIESVKTRARWVVEQLLPDSDYSLLFDIFPEPSPLQTGVNWCDSDTSPGILTEKSFGTGASNRMINPRYLLPSGGSQSDF